MGPTELNPPICVQEEQNSQILALKVRDSSHQAAENDGEHKNRWKCVREAPEHKYCDAAPQCASKHDPGVREAVAEVADDDLADDPR